MTKAALLRTLPSLYALVPLRVRQKWQPPMHSQADGKPFFKGIPVNDKGEAWDVEITARFFSYAAIGWCVVELSPLVFDALEW